MRFVAIVRLCIMVSWALVLGLPTFAGEFAEANGSPAGYYSPAQSQSIAPQASTWWPRRTPADRIGIDLGVVGLIRKTPDSQPLAIDQNFTELLNASELRGDMQFGLNAKLSIFQVASVFGGTDLQLGYFGVNSMDATRTLSATEVSPIFFNSVPANPASTSNIIYSTNLYSGEANLRFLNSRRIRPIAGFRYLKLEDTYDAFNFSNGGRLGGFSLTNNEMFGGQFGAEATLFRFRGFDFFANAKYGAMNNQVEGAATAADISNSTVVKNYRDSNFSSLVDAEAGITYNFVGGLDFKVAYQYLYASDVATGLAVNDSVRLLSPGETVTFASQWWQGISFGAQFSF